MAGCLQRTTPRQLFAVAWNQLAHSLQNAGRDPYHFPNAIATMLFYITDDRHEADFVLRDLVAPALNRPADVLAQRLLIGPAEECAAKLTAYEAAGAQRVLLWPV